MITPGEADADREEARGLAVVGGAALRRRGRSRVVSSPADRAHRLRLGAALVVRGLDPERQLDPPHPLEDPLRHHPLPGQEVADHAEREELDRGDEEHGAEDQRLDVAVAVAVEDPVDQERQPGEQGEHADDERRRWRRRAAARSGRRSAGSPARCGARRRRSSRTAATRASAGWSRPSTWSTATSIFPAWIRLSSV